VDTINQTEFRKEYDKFLPSRTALLAALQSQVTEAVSSLSSHLRIEGRLKTFESYFQKYVRNLKDPALSQWQMVTDLLGIRVVCPFLDDIVTVENIFKQKFEVVEVERKGKGYTLKEFGYQSIHLLIRIPEDLLKAGEGETACTIAEIQIRTILQDAWAELEHELIYKAEFTPFDYPLKRKLAAVNATLSLADIIFQEIRGFQRQLNRQLGKRKESFFRKIEASTDPILIPESVPSPQDDRFQDDSPSSNSIDELLLNALYAHNRNQFPKAIEIYTQILTMNPVKAVQALIYKHRGMAYFARSLYEKALSDFAESQKLDPASQKSAYYEGIIFSVLKRYPEALDAFNRSLAIDPYQPYCLYRRAQAYYHLGDYPRSLGDCEDALIQEPLEVVQKFRALVLDKLKM